MAVINKLEVTVLPQTYFTSAEKAIARNNIGALDINEYKFDVTVSNGTQLTAALINPDVKFINVINKCTLGSINGPNVQGDKYIFGKEIYLQFDSIKLNNYKLFFLNEACENTDDSDYQGNFTATSSDAGVYIKNLYGGANVRHASQPGTYVYQTNYGVNTDFTQSNWVTPELENYNKVKYYNEKIDNVYDTVAVNSATWNESGGTTYSAGPNINITDNVISGKNWSNEINTKLDSSAFTLPTSANWDNTYNTVNSNSASWSSGIEDVTTSGSYLRTSAGWSEYNEPDPCTLCCENFVEWNFNRQSTDTRAAHPLLALCDTSGTPSGTLNTGDKYMIYLDGLLGQSANNNTYVNFGIQSGTVSGQYLLSGNGAPLPSKKLCRSTSTGNDFACSFMFTVPTNGSYSVAVQPAQNNQEYKFFGNTTIRQIKIG